MGNSYISIYVHAVFRTKNSAPFLGTEVCGRLYPYFGGVARDEKMKLLAVGGMADHVHLLLSLSANISMSGAMQALKTASSRWIHDTCPQLSVFGWQEGYGAFSVGFSQIDITKAYIARQAEHHQQRTFMDEYVAFLQKHDIPYDERSL